MKLLKEVVFPLVGLSCLVLGYVNGISGLYFQDTYLLSSGIWLVLIGRSSLDSLEKETEKNG